MSNGASEPDATVPPHERVQRHAVGITRMCLRNGSVQLPRSLDGALPRGEIIVLDVARDEPLALWSEPPRTLSGLTELFDAHDVMVNDELVIELEDTDIRLSVTKRPRRNVTRVTPSTWTSLQEPTPARPAAPSDRGSTVRVETAIPAPATLRNDASMADGWIAPNADADDDTPRAPRVRPRTDEVRSHPPRTVPTRDEIRRKRSAPRGSWLDAVRSFFRGEQPTNDGADRSNDERNDASSWPDTPAVPPASRSIQHEPGDEGVWRVAHDGLLEAEERETPPPPPRAASHHPSRESHGGSRGGPSSLRGAADRSSATPAPPASTPARRSEPSGASDAPRKVGPASVAPPATPFPHVGGGQDAAPLDDRSTTMPAPTVHTPMHNPEALLDEDDIQAGDLRTRLLRYLRRPEMPIVAKSERIAKRFDLAIETTDELLADIAADPPDGLRLIPIRDGAWRIERRLS